MNKVFIGVIAGGLTLCVSGSAIAQETRTPIADRAEVNEPVSIKVPAEGGEFVLNTRLNPDNYLDELTGNVTNNTNRDWNIVVFSVIVFDEDGNRLEGAERIIIRNINEGETKEIGLLAGSLITDSSIEEYEIELTKATYNVNYSVRMTNPVGSEGMTFEDDRISVNWVFNESRLGFELKNNAKNPIKIDWNNVSYINPDGTAKKVIHGGVRYINRNDLLSPTVVPPTANIEDIIVPADNINYVSGTGYSSSGWEVRPLFPNGESALEYEGKTFSVFMPLEINGETYNYTFTFSISDVEF